MHFHLANPVMLNSLKSAIVINAALFQIVWFACVISGVKNLLWPALISFAVLAAWQLPVKRRHSTDLKLMLAAIVMGLFFDSLWVQLGFLEYPGNLSFFGLAPIWIIVLWMGFALTINHSLTWMSIHPALPATLGAICGPSSYLAGMKLGAVTYQADIAVVSICLAVAWGFSIWFFVRLSQAKPPNTTVKTATT